MASANGCFPLFSRSNGKKLGYFGFRRETAGQRFGGNYGGTLVDESESAGIPPTHSREMSQRNGLRLIRPRSGRESKSVATLPYSVPLPAAFWQRIQICRNSSVFCAIQPMGRPMGWWMSRCPFLRLIAFAEWN